MSTMSDQCTWYTMELWGVLEVISPHHKFVSTNMRYVNQSINVYSPKQPTGFSNRRRLAEPLVDNIEICTGVDIYTQVNIIYRRYAQQVQEPQHDPPTQPGPTEINQVQADCRTDPRQPARRGHCTQPPPWQPSTFGPLLLGTLLHVFHSFPHFSSTMSFFGWSLSLCVPLLLDLSAFAAKFSRTPPR